MTAVRQLSGKGIKGLEHCPPIFHFDLAPKELQSLLVDPEKIMQRMGFKLEFPLTVTLLRWNEAYSETKGWVPLTGKTAKPVRGCCYVDNDSMI